MNKDIVFTGDFEITMHKTLWSDNELALAKCLSFTHNINESTIVVDLRVTNKVSIIEFIKESFQRVWNHAAEEYFKASLLCNIEESYNTLYGLFSAEILPKLGYQGILYQHQKDSLFMAINKQFNFFALEQGLGKTLVAASVSKMCQIRRTLIICPASLKHNWMKDLCRGVGGYNELYFSLLDSNKNRTIKAFQERFVICNYESLEKHMEHILSAPLGHVIIDECTKIKSTSTRNFKLTHKIIEANPTSKVSLLSGTPVRNRINDLYAYLKLVGHPLGANYAHFLREYTISSRGRANTIRITGAKNTELLWRQTSNFMIRMRKQDCLDLPEKIYSKLSFELGDYKNDYDKAVREALESSGKTSLNASVHSINIVTSKAKLPGIIEFIENTIEQGNKIVVFSGYTVIVEALRDKFGDKCVMINGSVNSFDRSEMVDRFMTDDSCMVFIGNTLAAGTGLTLTAASNMLFCDFPFSPADLVQAEDRIHRIGAKNVCNINYAMAEGSIDEHLYGLIADKAHDAAKVIDNEHIEMNHSNLAEVLISKLRDEYHIPVKDAEAGEVTVESK